MKAFGKEPLNPSRSGIPNIACPKIVDMTSYDQFDAWRLSSLTR